MMFPQSNLPNTEIGTRSRILLQQTLPCSFRKTVDCLWNFRLEKVLSVESLVSHSVGDKNIKRNADSRQLAYEVSEGSKDSTEPFACKICGIWPAESEKSIVADKRLEPLKKNLCFARIMEVGQLGLKSWS